MFMFYASNRYSIGSLLKIEVVSLVIQQQGVMEHLWFVTKEEETLLQAVLFYPVQLTVG